MSDQEVTQPAPEAKKQRKQRSDKGKARGPRSKKDQVQG